MNTKIIASLGMMAAFISLGNSVYAQSPASISNTEQYTVTGDSLIGINKRTAQDDFQRFFEPNNLGSNPSTNNRRGNATPVKIRFNESLSQPNTPVLLVPAESGNDNQGAQVQLDLGDE
jgi:hypothetical protein